MCLSLIRCGRAAVVQVRGAEQPAAGEEERLAQVIQRTEPYQTAAGGTGQGEHCFSGEES